MYDGELQLSVCSAVDERLENNNENENWLLKKKTWQLNKACTRQLNNEQILYKAQGSEKEIWVMNICL